LAQWEERKALEKKAKARNSVLDDVPTAQPALALAHKVVQRVVRAGLPADLIPEEITTITVTADVDAENTLRTAVLEFIDTVRGTEKAIAADRRGEHVPAELDVAPVGVITEEEWRAHWLPAVEVGEPVAPEDNAGEPADEADDAADEPAQESEEPDAETDTADGEAATGESAEKDEDSSDDRSKATESQ